MPDFHLGHVPGTVIVDADELKVLRAVAEAAKELREAKKALMHLGWAAHSHEADALVALYKALLALDALEPPKQ